MDKKIKVLGIAGSLRSGSYNLDTLRVAQKMAPEEIEIEIFSRLGEIPPFNQDEENDPVEAVHELKEKIKAADAILFVTPEYNYSVPGVLKNAIDWASRPYGQNVWEGKPVAVIGASIGAIGTARAQYHLRQIFVFLDMHPLNRPEVMIGNAQEKFDEKGNIIDTHTKEKIEELLAALVLWTKKFNK
ncbi:MAG: NAD(P)H-dependent oxidoreductase [Parcubacteria group bacterium]|jgi:chromate reductase